MNRKQLASIGIGVLMFVAAATAVRAAQRAPTNEKTRKKILELTTRLETEPLSKKAKDQRKQVLTLIRSAPDMQVEPCRALLGELLLAKRLEAQQLYVQLQISTAGYLAEHPEMAADRERTLVAGLEGVLRTYASMRHTNPTLEIELINDLVDRQARDELDDYVRDTLGDCSR